MGDGLTGDIHEDHRLEQFFWDDSTCFDLSLLLTSFRQPVLVGCPHLGEYLWSQGKRVTVLDIDDRYLHLPGFEQWDFHRPTRPMMVPDIIVCDPPFKGVKLSRLFKALREVCWDDQHINLIVAWPPDQRHRLVGTFAYFGLEPTGYRPGYVSTDAPVELFANFDVTTYGLHPNT